MDEFGPEIKKLIDEIMHAKVPSAEELRKMCELMAPVKISRGQRSSSRGHGAGGASRGRGRGRVTPSARGGPPTLLPGSSSTRSGNRMMGSASSARAATATITRDEVNDLIKSDNIVIFSKTSCPYSRLAKKLLHELRFAYTAIELDERDDANTLQGILREITGGKDVPTVFIKGRFSAGIGPDDVKKIA